MSYLSKTSTTVPQSRGLRGQVANRAGGFAWEVDCWTRLHRFLVLGTEGGTYYIGQSDLTLDNVEALEACLDENGPRAVGLITQISMEGRAPKNDPAIFALAYASVKGDDETRGLAYQALREVCRIGTHLFMFLGFREAIGGWSRGLRSAVAAWYLEKPDDQLAYQLVKYRQRGGWTHHDALLLSHAKPETAVQDELFNFVKPQEDHDGNMRSWSRRKDKSVKLPDSVRGFKKAQKAKSAKGTAEVIGDYTGLPWEALNPDHLKDPLVWAQLLENGMPMTALIRNLAKLTQLGVLKPLGTETWLSTVCKQIDNLENLHKAKVHPLALLFARATYSAGQGFRGTGTWTPVPKIVGALDSAFHKAFVNVEPTNKRTLIGVDASGSMQNMQVANSFLRVSEAAAAMAMVTVNTEPEVFVLGYDTDIYPTALRKGMTLGEAMRTMRFRGGGTDCSLPMLYAEKERLEVDTFIIITDNETWAGRMHPAEAIKKYRKSSGIDAKVVVCAMSADGFSVADPNDPGMLDVVGFDASVPQVIADFVAD